MLRKLCALTAALMFIAPLTATAQEDDGGPEVFGKQLDVSSSFITSTGGSSSTTTSSVSGFSDEFSELERQELLRDRLEHDRAAVAEAVALGAGDALGDLAMIFGVPQAQKALLGRALRARRGALLALLAGAPGGMEEAAEFMRIVGPLTGDAG